MEKHGNLAPVAQAALRQSHVPALRNVEVYEVNGRIVLCGKVNLYYHKQLAQQAVLAVLNAAVPIDNRLKVEKKAAKRSDQGEPSRSLDSSAPTLAERTT